MRVGLLEVVERAVHEELAQLVRGRASRIRCFDSDGSPSRLGQRGQPGDDVGDGVERSSAVAARSARGDGQLEPGRPAGPPSARGPRAARGATPSARRRRRGRGSAARSRATATAAGRRRCRPSAAAPVPGRGAAGRRCGAGAAASLSSAAESGPRGRGAARGRRAAGASLPAGRRAAVGARWRRTRRRRSRRSSVAGDAGRVARTDACCTHPGYGEISGPSPGPVASGPIFTPRGGCHRRSQVRDRPRPGPGAAAARSGGSP